MSSNWTRYRLEELGDIVTGKTPPSKVQDAFSYSGTQFVTPRDMDGRRWIDSTERFLSESGVAAVKNSLVPSGSVAVSCIGSDMGKAVLLKVESVTNQQINTLVVDTQKFNAKFVYYVLSTKQDEFKSIAGGSATPILNKGHFGKFEIDLPTKDEQDFLVRCLDSLDSKIENNTQANQTLEQIAQALFKSWFVNFDPVKAKMETLAAGGSADDAELAAMSVISAKTNDELNGLKASNPEAFNKLAQTAALFPDAMQDSELGEIPEGWGAVQIGDIVQRLKPKKRYTKKQVQPYGKIPVYEQGASILLGFHNDYAGFDASPEDPVFIFGDHTCITHLSCSKFDISSNVIPLKGSVRPTIWAYYAIQGKQKFQEYRRHWSEFIIKDVVLPSVELTEEYAELVTTKYLMIESLKRQSKELEQLRDALLPKLLSGEKNVTSEVVE